MNRDPDDFFTGFSPPSAPTGLRPRALAAALAEPEAEAQRPARRWIDHLWESRPLRLAWAATVAVLLTVHLALANDLRSPTVGSASHLLGRESGHRSLAVTDSDLARFLSRHPAQRARIAARDLDLDTLVSEPSSTLPVTALEGGSV